MGLQHSLNFRIQNHKMKLVEVEGTHTLQTTYSSLDVHVGQSYSVLVTADQPGHDYYIVVSSRFSTPILTTTGILHYSGAGGQVSGPIPGGPTIQIDWSLNQARSIRYLLIPLLRCIFPIIFRKQCIVYQYNVLQYLMHLLFQDESYSKWTKAEPTGIIPLWTH